MSPGRSPTPSDYDDVYRRRQHSSALDDVVASVTGHQEIAAFQCTGFLGAGDRERLRTRLGGLRRPTRGRPTLLDIGCGEGILGVWLAQQLDCDLLGIDSSPVAIALARRSVPTLMRRRTRFAVATFESTGLDARSVAAAFSLDSLYLAAEPRHVLAELRRVLQSNAPLVFSYYVDPSMRCDWVRLATTAGFSVHSVSNVTADWRRYMRAKHRRRWQRRHMLQAALGARWQAELGVTRAMLGLDGTSSYITATSRYIVCAVRD